MGCFSSKPAVKHEQSDRENYSEVIPDRFETIDAVQQSLREAGLESSELILAIDFTKSNEWSGAKSFGGQSLHSTAQGSNPYKSVVSIICKTLAAFDDDKLIPTFSFGDATTQDHSLLSFEPQGRPLHAVGEVLAAYDRLAPRLNLSGPTSFAPAINHAIKVVKASGGTFHVLLIVADGQVTPGTCMTQTVDAIREASHYPMSIIMVGVGDGPFDQMETFDDALKGRKFDNFQFVNFTELCARAGVQGFTPGKWEAEFAMRALMEIPDQYRKIVKMNLLRNAPQDRPVPAVKIVLPGSVP